MNLFNSLINIFNTEYYLIIILNSFVSLILTSNLSLPIDFTLTLNKILTTNSFIGYSNSNSSNIMARTP